MENAFCDVILACEDNWNGAYKLVLNLKTHYNPIEIAIISDHGKPTCFFVGQLHMRSYDRVTKSYTFTEA